ncbi:MAG TPA: hypothetical protein VGE97_00395 [Nitrososphaera sp.]|jgi:hypothetical protein
MSVYQVALAVFIIAFLLGMIFYRWYSLREGYSGVIVVTKTPEKLLYSLEVDNPEEIALHKVVIFKVNVLDDESQ